jgi:hypothetical protein
VAISSRPSIPLSVLKDNKTLNQFLNVLFWAVKEIRAS